MRKDKKDEVTNQNHQDPRSGGRRRFMNQALTASAGIAVSRFLPHFDVASVYASAAAGPSSPNELINPGEIQSNSQGLLQSVMVVKDEERVVPTVSGKYMLRAYEGYRGTKIDPRQRVTKPGVYNPGPTFRANVGDTIQIALLNHINPAQFPETPDGQCDTTTDATTGKELYRDTPAAPAQRDQFPDCFRGSNTTNMHFHGTHVSPNAFSDNVLVEIIPDLTSTPEMCQAMFNSVACKDYPTPQAWKHQDAATTQALQNLIQQNQQRLEKLAPEKKDATLHQRQATQNKTEQEYGEFPQFWAGCFPYCIRPPKSAPPFTMAQAPGTHWYHAHKHGSTTIQMFNGMSGALILQGDYDKTLEQTMPGVQQKVLVLQQFADQPNMERSGGAGVAGGGGGGQFSQPTPLLLVNGQANPVITMQPGEVQWWRIINATVQSGHGGFICSFAGSANMVFRQIAQDGVQLAWLNYQPQISNGPTNFLMGPGNRVDILVKAPSTTGTATLGGAQGAGTSKPFLTVNVVAATGKYNTNWPSTQSDYPQMPSFLGDITQWSEDRTLKYQMDARGSTPKINDQTFQEGIVNESMLLGTKQEWTIENFTTIPAWHPFHIHVNPFQIVEIFDPTGSLSPLFGVGKTASFGDWSKVKQNPNGSFSLPTPWLWWDTFPLPLAKDANTPGYIKMRTWFTDFAGKFVDHCHILAHEDRGMMQLIEVVDNKTVYKHH
jgi:FtsP/CotA-like multicopper oxidase with cupredoxin domain